MKLNIHLCQKLSVDKNGWEGPQTGYEHVLKTTANTIFHLMVTE